MTGKQILGICMLSIPFIIIFIGMIIDEGLANFLKIMGIIMFISWFIYTGLALTVGAL